MKFVSTLLFVITAIIIQSIGEAQATSFNENETYFKQASEKAEAIDFGKGRVIAVLDTGINDDNIELHDQVIAEYDATTGSSVAVDNDGHGTRIASVIAAKKDGKGITGIAHEAKLIDVKVVDDSGNIATEDIISGIEFAVEHGANVINMSFSSGEYSQELAQVIEKFSEQGVLFVASAGNDGSDAVTYPAGYTHVTAVSSLERGTGKRAVYANYGEFVDEYVEDDIWTYDGEKYSREKGTSEAAAVVSSMTATSYARLNREVVTEGQEKYKLSQVDTKDNISFFSEDNVNNYLNDLAAYNIIHPHLIDSFYEIATLKLDEIINHTSNPFVGAEEIIINSSSTANAYIVLFDIFSEYADYAYRKDTSNKVAEIQTGAVTSYTKLLAPLIEDVKQITVANKKASKITKQINEIILATEGKSDPLSKTIRKWMNYIVNGYKNPDISKYRAKYLHKNAIWNEERVIKIQKVVKTIDKTLKAYSNAVNAFSSYTIATRDIELLAVYAADYMVTISILDSTNMNGQSKLTEEITQIASDVSNSNESLEEMLDYFIASAVIKIFSDATGATTFAKNTIYNTIFKGKNNPFTDFVKEIINGIISETTTAYMYLLYVELAGNINFDSLLEKSDSYSLSVEHINKKLVYVTIAHKLLYHSMLYLHSLATNYMNIDGYNKAAMVALIKNYKVEEYGATYKINDGFLNSVSRGLSIVSIDQLVNFSVEVSQNLSKDDTISKVLDKIFGTDQTTQLNVITGRMSIESYLDSVDGTLLDGASDTVGKLGAIFNKYSQLAQTIKDYQNILSNLLSNKMIIHDIELANKKTEEKIDLIHEIWEGKNVFPSTDQYGQCIDPDLIQEMGIIQLETQHDLITQDMIIRKGNPVSRKLFIEMMLKIYDSGAIPKNPYDDPSFLTSLANAGIGEELTIFTDLNDGVTLNEKLWLEYGNYINLINGSHDTNGKPIVSPNSNITRLEAMLVVGRILKNIGRVVNDNDVICNVAKYNITDYDDMTVSQSEKEKIDLCIQEDIIHGKNKKLALEDPISIYETAVVAKRLYKNKNDLSTILNNMKNVGDLFDQNCTCTKEGFSFERIQTEDIPYGYSDVPVTLTAKTNVKGEDADKLSIIWKPQFGKLINFEKVINNEGNIESKITFIPPLVSKEVLLYVTSKLIYDNSLHDSKKYYMVVRPDEENPPSIDSKMQLSTQYLKEQNEFRLSWATQDVEQLEIRYSFDQETWNRYALLNLNFFQGDSYDKTIQFTENHNTIYFKTITTDSSGEQSTSTIKTLHYETIADTYVPKATETPATPSLSSLGDSTNKNSVTLRWKRVNDSYHHDNVDYYEVMVADNYRFDNPTTHNAGNNAAGENIYESCSYTVTNLSDDTRYYFKVRAVNSADPGVGNWSAYQSIRIDLEDLPYFETTGRSPVDNSTSVSKTPRFEWNAYDKDGDDLEFYVQWGESANALDSGSGWIERSELFNYSNKFITELKPNTRYYWQVMLRENGHYKDYYGGEYIKTPVWSFTTVATGQDLTITDAQLISELKPANPATFSVIITNNGTETAKAQWIKASYRKGTKTTEFNEGSAMMSKDLAPGESETLNLVVKFRDEVIPPNSYNGYEERDNVLIEGDSYVIFEIFHPSANELDSSNDSKEVLIHYANQGEPVFEYFSVGHLSVYNGEEDFPLYSRLGENIGRLSGILFDVVDDIKVTKATIEYRKNANDSWHLIDTLSNATDHLQVNYDWIIPEDESFVTNSFEVRVRAYENDSSYSERTSYPFPVYSNHLILSDFSFDKASYSVGEQIAFGYKRDNEYPIRTMRIRLKGENSAETLYDLFSEEGIQPEELLLLSIPPNNNLAHDNSYLEILISDIHSNTKTYTTNTFTVSPNTELPAPFDDFVELYKPLNTNFPVGADIVGSESYNVIEAVEIDANNLVHAIVASKASYLLRNDSYWHHNIDYLYLTYDEATGTTSTPILLTSTLNYAHDRSGLYLKDFILFNGEPFILLGEDKQGESNKFYYMYKQGSSFSTLTLFTDKTSVWSGMEFFQHSGFLYAKWVDKGLNAPASSMRNKFKALYPSTGAEQSFADFYLGGGVRVHDDYLYASCNKLYGLDSNLHVTGLLNQASSYSCTAEGEFAVYTEDTNILEASPVYDDHAQLHILKNDYSSFVVDSYTQANDVAVFDDQIMYIGYNSTSSGSKNKISIIDLNTLTAIDVLAGDRPNSTQNYKLVAVNKNKQVVLANLGYKKTYLSVGDFSQDIQAPQINITNTETFLEKGTSLLLQWEVSDNTDELIQYEIYELSGGSEALLTTITDIATTEYNYTLSPSAPGSYVTLKVVAYDLSGNAAYDIIRLDALDAITFNSFTVNKSVMNLGEKLIFSWNVAGASASTRYTVQKQYIGSSEWSDVFTVTGGTTKSFTVNNFAGEYTFKILSGDKEMSAENTVLINGEILVFDEDAFRPDGVYYGGDTVKLEWEDSLETSTVLYSVLVKKDGETTFSKIGETTDRHLEYITDGTPFIWKISAQFNGRDIISSEHAVQPETLAAPQNLSTIFAMIDGNPQITLNFDPVENAQSYIIARERNGYYQEVASVTSATYLDEAVQYGTTYIYSVIAVHDEYHSLPSEESEIKAELDDPYGVIIDNANYQTVASNSFTLSYRPTAPVAYEAYEIRLGTDPSDLPLYTVTPSRTLEITGLKYAQNYYIEIFPIDYAGCRLSSVPAELSFTTGFDARPIIGTFDLMIYEVGTDHVSLSWKELDNVDFYSICRSENGGAFECFDTTSQTAYSDYVNLAYGQSYRYLIKAVNGFTSVESPTSAPIVIPDPTLDSDGDGIPDYQDTNNNDGPDADPDNDGKVNSVDLDDDNDGMLDSCESQYSDYLDQWEDDASDDIDFDGFTNLEECRMGTDPTDYQDFPVNKGFALPAIMFLLLN